MVFHESLDRESESLTEWQTVSERAKEGSASSPARGQETGPRAMATPPSRTIYWMLLKPICPC